jgi:uncharacterized protein (DUF1330 family)
MTIMLAEYPRVSRGNAGDPPADPGAQQMPVDPTGADLKRFLADDPGGPVVMLNLLRFKPGGRASYEQYADEIRPFLAELGAHVVYVGDCSTALVAPDEHRWDAVLVVEYPSRGAFSAMVANPDYQRITGLRTEALSDAVLQATVPWA